MSKILIAINEKCQSVLNKFSRLKNLLNFNVRSIVTCKLVVSYWWAMIMHSVICRLVLAC